MLHFGRKLDIFGDDLTKDFNWAKMMNKERKLHVKDEGKPSQKRPGPAGPEPLGRPA